MKKLIFCILISIQFFSNINAQQIDTLPWSPPGATWLYVGSSFGSTPYFKFVYTSDTIISNKVAKKIVVTQFELVGPNKSRTKEQFAYNLFYYSSKDSVFWFNKTEFQLLYVFSAIKGSSYVIKKNNYATIACTDSTFNTDSNLITITDVQKMNFSNIQFDVVTAKTQQYWTIGSVIIKNIGSINSPPFPISGSKCSMIDATLGNPGQLTCYYDSLRGYINFGGGSSLECRGTITTISDLNKSTVENSNYLFKIVPNPVSSSFYIDYDFGFKIKSVKIYDLMGRECISICAYSNASIDISTLSNAMYIVKLTTENNRIFSSKFLKE